MTILLRYALFALVILVAVIVLGVCGEVACECGAASYWARGERSEPLRTTVRRILSALRSGIDRGSYVAALPQRALVFAVLPTPVSDLLTLNSVLRI